MFRRIRSNVSMRCIRWQPRNVDEAVGEVVLAVAKGSNRLP
jgi:hypothetical protein